jgi:hypothetical protein
MITPSYGLTATERVLPRLALDFTTAALDSRITFTRSGNTATVTNSSGLIAGVNADLPRFDFDPITKICKGLLIEESRANICIRSETFNLWNTTGSVGVTANTTVAPDGNQTADTITRVAGQGDSVLLAQTFTGDGVKAISVWIKKGTSPSSLIVLFDATASLYRLWADVTWSGNTPVLAFTNGSLLKSTEYDNNFWRLEFATTAVTAANTNRIQIFPARAGSANDDNVICWGAQAENGAFATSYVPTEATAVTRNADVATMTGTNFSDWFNATEGTFNLQYSRIANAVSGKFPYAGQIYSDINNRIDFYQNSNSSESMLVRTSGSTVASANFTVATAGQKVSNVLAYKQNNFGFSTNAANTITDSLGNVPSLTTFAIGTASSTGFELNGWMQKINYWPQRITNAEVQAFSK